MKKNRYAVKKGKDDNINNSEKNDIFLQWELHSFKHCFAFRLKASSIVERVISLALIG